jgi:hypothetical protein
MIVVHRLHRLVRLAKADPNQRFDRLFRDVLSQAVIKEYPESRVQ